MKEFHDYRGPYMRSKGHSAKMMRNVFLALTPIIGFACYKNGIFPYLEGKTDIYGCIYPLLFILVTMLTSYLTEACYHFVFMKKRGSSLKEVMANSYALFPGLFLSLIMPINTPIELMMLGAFIATIFGKMIYGGFGYNIFNPALIGSLFIISIYGSVITSHGGYFNPYELDTISHATPLSNVAVVDGIGTYQTLVEPYGNLFDFFFGTIPGAMGEVSALLCLLAFLFLAFTRTIKVKIPILYIATVFGMTTIIASLNGVGMWYSLFQIFSGGLFFGAVFMATDPVTTPVTPTGQALFGICLGILTVILRYLTPYPEGVLTSILAMNILVFLFDKIGSRVRGRAILKAASITIIVILAIGVAFGISKKYDQKASTNGNKDNNFELLETKQVGEKTIYIATQKGNGGVIKAEVTFEKGVATTYVILEHRETPSYYSLVEKEDYVSKLLQGQNQLDKVDTVSGATISSTALKKLLINLKEVANEK